MTASRETSREATPVERSRQHTPGGSDAGAPAEGVHVVLEQTIGYRFAPAHTTAHVSVEYARTTFCREPSSDRSSNSFDLTWNYDLNTNFVGLKKIHFNVILLCINFA